MSINSFAAIVSDNDGSAFVTKAEFELLKKNFSNQITNYNTSIDGKIDGAIASYLAGINLNKPIHTSLFLPDEVYCMLNKSDSETKDLQYVYARPQISGDGVDWHANSHGIYAWAYTFNSRAGEETGERNMIDSLYLSETDMESSARWIGHWKNVKEIYKINGLISKLGNDYGKHANDGKYDVMINPPYKTLENVLLPLTGNKSNFLDYNTSYGNSSGNSYSSQGLAFTNEYVWPILKFSQYKLEKSMNFQETKKALLLFYPEEYYGFTYDNCTENFVGFDRYLVTSDANSTVCPTLHTAYPNLTRYNGGTYGDGPTAAAINGNKEGWFSTIFNTASTISTQRGFFQSNMEDKKSHVEALSFSGRWWVDPYYSDYGNAGGWRGTNNYLYINKRFPWPIVTFPWKYIKNWSQLWQSSTDWAIHFIDEFDTTSWIVRKYNGKNHLSIAAGYPLFEVKKEKKYKFDIKFAEANDHLVFVHYGPFYTTSPETENDNAITEFVKSAKIEMDSRFTNAIVVKAGEKVSVEFETTKDDVIFLKWCDKPDPSNFINGGGTLITPKEYIVSEIS